VTVNGSFLGVYANVEPVTKRLLRRFFAADSGNLYEGQLSDFRPGWSGSYEKKTNEDDPDRSDLDAVTAALQAGDADLEGALGKVLDIDAFMRFWAMETLVAAWDGYAGNINNHFVYNDPGSGKMAFLPWGPDMSFNADDPFHPGNRPQSVSAKGVIAFRLYSVPAKQARYVDEMKAILKDVWEEDAILAEIDRMQMVLSPHVGPSAPMFEGAGDAVRGFVSSRRSAIEAEIGPGPAAWPFPLPGVACLSTLGTVSGTFSTTWGTTGQNPFIAGKGTFDFAIPADKAQVGMPVGAVSGEENGSKGRPQVIVAASFPDGKVRALVFNVHPVVFAPGSDAPFNWQAASGVALDVTQQGMPITIGLFGDGQVHFDKAAAMPGAPVSGSFSASVIGSKF
jgi:hypothetical protein